WTVNSAMCPLAWARWLRIIDRKFPIAKNQNPASEGVLRRSAAMARAGPYVSWRWRLGPARFGSYFGGCFSIYRTSSMPASLIGRLGSSAFRLSTNSSVDVAHGLALLFGLGTKGPSIMGIRRRGGTIFRATLPSM